MRRIPEPKLSPAALYGLYAAKIERLILRVLGPDSEQEDLHHDVLMTVFEKVHTLRDPDCLDSWVAQVTFNTLKYTMRQRRIRRHASWDAIPDSVGPRFQTNFETRDLAWRAVRVLERLPRSDRILLLSYWFTSENAAEIAARTGCSTVTVRRRLFKARSRFERLANRDPELVRCIAVARRTAIGRPLSGHRGAA